MKLQANQDMTRVDRVGQALARHLNDSMPELPHDISERLRVARILALSQRKHEPNSHGATTGRGRRAGHGLLG